MMLEEKLGELLRARRLSVSCAESCTGGLIAHRITNVAGSSDYFPGGVVSYSNESKRQLLGVSEATLIAFGAVSAETVREMANGARKLLHADLAIAVSGVAGPSGGSAEKPVGTTWIGLASADSAWTRHFLWRGDREQNKAQSADAALQLAIDFLEGNLQ